MSKESMLAIKKQLKSRNIGKINQSITNIPKNDSLVNLGSEYNSATLGNNGSKTASFI